MFEWYQWSSRPAFVAVVRKGHSLPHVESGTAEPGEWLLVGVTSDLPASRKEDFEQLGFFLKRLDNVASLATAAELSKLIG